MRLDRAGGPTEGAISWAQCRALARVVRRAPRGQVVNRSLRPRAGHGLWSQRAPLAVQFWVAARQGRVVSADAGRSLAVVDAPLLRRAELARRSRRSVLHLIDRWWELAIYAAVPAALLATAVVVVLALPGNTTARVIAVAAALTAAAWITVTMALGLLGALSRGVRSGTAAHAESSVEQSLAAAGWTITLFHAEQAAEVLPLLDAARRRVAGLWEAMPALPDFPRPTRLVVQVDAVTTDEALDRLLRHPHRIHPRQDRTVGSIVVIGDPAGAGAPSAGEPPEGPRLGAEGIGWVVGGALAILPMLALIISWQEADREGPGVTPSDVGTFAGALGWLLGQFTWTGQAPWHPALHLGTRVLGLGVRALALVVLLSVVAATARHVARRRRVAERVHRDLQRAQSRLAPTLAVITIVPEEFSAVAALLDELPAHPGADEAGFRLGELPSSDPDRPHLVVLARQQRAGTGPAAALVTDLTRTFPSLTHVVVCGTACGVPRPRRPDRHVRLGDIVVAAWGVVAYDHVDDHPDGERLREREDHPARDLVVAAESLLIGGHQGSRPWEGEITRGLAGLEGFGRPGEDTDVLHGADGAVIAHPAQDGRRPGWPMVHLGRIGSSDRSLRNPASRDRVGLAHDLLALDMETAGVAAAARTEDVRWFAVRGISDYGDETTTGTWRPYACLAAAGYLRALLAQVPPSAPASRPPLGAVRGG